MPRLALITGATSGLGEALCNLLFEKKIPLFLTGRNTKQLQLTASRYRADAMPLDLCQSREPLLNWIEKHTPDLIINNAGFSTYGPVLMHPIGSQMDILEVNGVAAMEISIASARALYAKQKEGVVLNVSSAVAELPIPSMAVYAASKSFLTSFSKSFDTEMKPHGIRILAAMPGQIATPFAFRASQGTFSQSPSWMVLSPRKVAEKIWKQIETKRAVQTIDFRYKALLALAKWMPRSFVESFLQKTIAKRIPI